MSLRKFLLIFIFLTSLVVIVYRFHVYIVKENFTVQAHTTCDVSVESCFVESCEEPGCVQEPYKKIFLSMKDAPSCVFDYSCTNFSCTDIEDCKILYCNDETREETEECVLVENTI